MRSVRLVAHLVAAVALATCTDSPTGPRAPRTAHLALAPVFTARANLAAAELHAAGIAVASIRVVISRPGTSDVLVDKVIEVVPGESSVTLEIDVTIQGAEELLTAKLQYRDANGLVLYEGEQSITAKQGTNAATEIGQAQVDYVGPGATAKELLLSPIDTVISTTTPLTLVVKAKDAEGTVIESPLVVWSSSDAALATVNAAGVVTPIGPRGVVKIAAKIPSGVGAEATLRLVPPAAQVSVFSGGGQSGVVGTVLPTPFKVQVKAADGVGAAGMPVTFEAVTEGGSVGTATATTNVDGYAFTTIALGGAVGEYQFKATAGTLEPVTISATATPLPTPQLTKIGGDAQADTIEALLAAPLVVELRDANGTPVANQQVEWRAIPTASYESYSYPNVMLVADPTLPDSEQEWYVETLSTVTDAQGRAQMHVRLDVMAANPAVVRATAVAHGITTDFTLSVKPGAADWLRVVQSPTTMRAGLPMATPLQAQVVDRWDNPVALANLKVALDPSYGGTSSEQPGIRASALRSTATGTTGRPSRPIHTAPVRTTRTASPTTASDTTLATGTTRTASVVPARTVLSPSGTSTVQSIIEDGTITGDTVFTDATGKATFTDLTVGGPVGLYWLDVFAPTLEMWGSADATTTMEPGVVAKLDVHPTDFRVEALPGEHLAVEARLTDAWNNHIAADATARTITWSTAAGAFTPAGTATATSTMTGGLATITFVAPATAGTVSSVTATTGGLTGEPATVTGTTAPITVIAPVPSAIMYGAATAAEAGDRQVVLVGGTLTQPLVAKVVDSRGLPMANTRVAWERWDGSAGYAKLDTTVTDANGVTSLLPALTTAGAGYGYIFTASPVDYSGLSLLFQAATRPDATYDRVWFGEQWDGTQGTTDWSAATAWHGGTPTATSKVLIPQWGTQVTSPALSAATTVAELLNMGSAYTSVELAGQTLTVTGNLGVSWADGTGVIRMTGTGATARAYVPGAKLEIASGASVTVAEFLQAAGIDVQGTLSATDVMLSVTTGDLVVGAAGRLDLIGSAGVGTPNNVILEAGSTFNFGTGVIGFHQNFDYRGTAPLLLDPASSLMGAFIDATARTINLPAGSGLGNLYLSGPEGGTSVTLPAPVNIQGLLQLVDVSLSVDSIPVHGTVHVDAASSMAGVRILDSYGSAAPMIEGAPPQQVNINVDAFHYSPSRYNNLEVRALLATSGHRIDVAGNLWVIGQGGLQMGGATGTDSLIVQGVAHFAGATASQSLAKGAIILRGDFMQADPEQRSPGAFRPGAELEVVFAGRTQNVTFQTPSNATGTGSYFHRVRVEPEAIVTQKSSVFATGRLEVRSGGSWVSDDFNAPEPARLLDVSGSGTELRALGTMQLSRLNLYTGVKVDIQDPGSVTAKSCYDEGAELLGLQLNCLGTSQIPLLGSLLGVLGGTSPLTSVALAAIEERRRAGE